MPTNKAREILYPTDANILVRVSFLYVGQGASALVFIADGDTYRVLLVDINLDRKAGGIDVPRLTKDLLDGAALEVFVNTHPHDDHLCGTKELSDLVKINNVWHSDHKPSKKYGSKHSELTDLIKKVNDAGGGEVIIETTDAAVTIGEAQYHFLSPKEHVRDDVNEEDADARRARIHEMCGVIKFGTQNSWILISGDADLCAFREHIMPTHDADLPSFVLGASHHGSRSFFVANEDDEPYLDALQKIDPSYVVVSAPLPEESAHEHPHEDAMQQYEKQVGVENVFHTGENRYSYIFDIYRDGTFSVCLDDKGVLAEIYGLEEEDGTDPDNRASASGPFVVPAKSSKPEYKPREFG